MHWAVWVFRKRRRVRARLTFLPDNQTGGSDAAPNSSVECELEQINTGRISQVRVFIPQISPRKNSPLTLEILESAGGSLLGRVEIRLLDPTQSRALILASLTADDLRLWIQNGARCCPGYLASVTSGFVIADARFAGSPFTTFTGPLTEELELNLLHGNKTTRVHHEKISFSAQPVNYRSPPIAIQDPELFSEPGDYWFQFQVGGKEIARLKFRLLNDTELVRHVRVTEIQADAETREGETVPRLKTLRWEEHRAFRPALQLENDIPAPNAVANCIVRILQGTTVLHREEFLIRLERGVRRIQLERMELGSPGLLAQPKPTRLVISACIGGEIKASTQLLVLPPERITNFEGQLTFDATDLPFDENEYDQIAQRLGLADEGTSKRGLWGWLKQGGRRSQAGTVPQSLAGAPESLDAG